MKAGKEGSSHIGTQSTGKATQRHHNIIASLHTSRLCTQQALPQTMIQTNQFMPLKAPILMLHQMKTMIQASALFEAPPLHHPGDVHACSMLLMKVWGCWQRGVSMIYKTMVGKVDAKASVMIAPEADQVKISICPGVSTMTYFG